MRRVDFARFCVYTAGDEGCSKNDYVAASGTVLANGILFYP